MMMTVNNLLKAVWLVLRDEVPEVDFPGIVRDGDWVGSEARNKAFEDAAFSRGVDPRILDKLKPKHWWDRYAGV
jgi:hypothetical protein